MHHSPCRRYRFVKTIAKRNTALLPGENNSKPPGTAVWGGTGKPGREVPLVESSMELRSCSSMAAHGDHHSANVIGELRGCDCWLPTLAWEAIAGCGHSRQDARVDSSAAGSRL